jgi:hypothetical protein
MNRNSKRAVKERSRGSGRAAPAGAQGRERAEPSQEPLAWKSISICTGAGHHRAGMTYADRTPAVVARISRCESEQASRCALESDSGGTDEGTGRVTVRIVRCSRYLLDQDNLYGSAKQILDRLVESEIIPGDGPGEITLEVVQFQVACPKEIGTAITVGWS